MAFSTYQELKDGVLAQTKRGDLDLKFDDLLAIAETEIKSNPNGALKLNLSEKISTAPTSTTTRFLALPTGLQSARKFSITINDGIYKIEFRTPDQMNIKPDTGTPQFYTLRGNELEFDIVPDIVYTVTMTYTAQTDGLTTINPTNYILTKYPNVYLFGCLKQAMIYVEKWEASGIYDGLFSEAIDAANTSEHDIKYPTQVQETVCWSP